MIEGGSVDHVVVVLDPDHARVVTRLAHRLATELAIAPDEVLPVRPHVTVASYRGIGPDAACRALGPATATLAPFVVRAHGYGVFAGDADSDLSLHVMVVRTRELDRLHRRIHRALCDAGATVAGTTAPPAWTPHITLLDRGLTPELLGRSVALLTCRPHRSWSVPVTEVEVTRRGERPGAAARTVPLAATSQRTRVTG